MTGPTPAPTRFLVRLAADRWRAVVLEPPVNRVLPVSSEKLDALRRRFR